MTSMYGPVSRCPAQLDYRMPAEWEPHLGTWVSWPHNLDTWPGVLPQVREFYVELIRAIADDEIAFVNVADSAMEDEARASLVQADIRWEHVRFQSIPTNDAWCRDYGAIFIRHQGTSGPGASSLPPLIATQWTYNAWGGKYPPYDRDQQVAESMAKALGVPCVPGGMVLEGGAVEVNGEGWLLTTEDCLLNPNRNPDRSRAQIESRLRDMLGVDEIVWLGGGVVGDDTDGHIDNLSRFVAPRTVVTVVEPNPHSVNYPPLQENLRRLESWRSREGQSLEIVTLPTPAPLIHEGKPLPASYGNFLITNGSVLVPHYRCEHDAEVREILQPLFPNRKIVGIDCTYAIRGLGAIHCLTQQVPAEK